MTVTTDTVLEMALRVQVGLDDMTVVRDLEEAGRLSLDSIDLLILDIDVDGNAKVAVDTLRDGTRPDLPCLVIGASDLDEAIRTTALPRPIDVGAIGVALRDLLGGEVGTPALGGSGDATLTGWLRRLVGRDGGSDHPAPRLDVAVVADDLAVEVTDGGPADEDAATDAAAAADAATDADVATDTDPGTETDVATDTDRGTEIDVATDSATEPPSTASDVPVDADPGVDADADIVSTRPDTPVGQESEPDEQPVASDTGAVPEPGVRADDRPEPDGRLEPDEQPVAFDADPYPDDRSDPDGRSDPDDRSDPDGRSDPDEDPHPDDWSEPDTGTAPEPVDSDADLSRSVLREIHAMRDGAPPDPDRAPDETVERSAPAPTGKPAQEASRGARSGGGPDLRGLLADLRASENAPDPDARKPRLARWLRRIRFTSGPAPQLTPYERLDALLTRYPSLGRATSVGHALLDEIEQHLQPDLAAILAADGAGFYPVLVERGMTGAERALRPARHHRLLSRVIEAGGPVVAPAGHAAGIIDGTVAASDQGTVLATAIRHGSDGPAEIVIMIRRDIGHGESAQFQALVDEAAPAFAIAEIASAVAPTGSGPAAT